VSLSKFRRKTSSLRWRI